MAQTYEPSIPPGSCGKICTHPPVKKGILILPPNNLVKCFKAVYPENLPDPIRQFTGSQEKTNALQEVLKAVLI